MASSFSKPGNSGTIRLFSDLYQNDHHPGSSGGGNPPILLPPPNFRRRPLTSFSTIGQFDRLPNEIILHLFSYLDLKALGQLSLTSEAMRVHVLAWVNSNSSSKRLFSKDAEGGGDGNDAEFDDASPFESSPWDVKETAFRSLWPSMKTHLAYAVLVKRVTCLLNTRERVRYAFEMFEIAVGFPKKDPKKPDHRPYSEDWMVTLRAVRFAAMINVFTLGWDESEYPVLLDAIDVKLDLSRKLQRFFDTGKREDLCVGAEMRLRLELRCLTWDFAGTDFGHRASWLQSIFLRFAQRSSDHQAMILYLLFGPTCQDSGSHYDEPWAITPRQRAIMDEINNHADWEVFADATPDDFREGKVMFFSLAQAVCCCHAASETWRNEMLSVVLEAIFTVPSNWRRENVAGFLLFCSEKLIMVYLKGKLDMVKDASCRAVAQLLVDMIVVSYRFDNDLVPQRGIGKIFDQICEYPEPSFKRPKLHKYILDVIIKELRVQELDLQDGEMLEILKRYGSYVAVKAYSQPRGRKIIEEEVNDEMMEE